MLIDWFTVAAQVINFLVLVWLLKKFLYRPIIDAMNEREQRIAAQLRDAETEMSEAANERESLRAAKAEFDAQKQASLRQAEEEAEATRQRLIEETRREIEAKRAKWLETLQEEQTTLRTEFSHRVQQEVFAIARQTLKDLAGEQLEERIASAFVDRLRGLDGEERARLALLVRTSRSPVQIRSAFSLPSAARTEIEAAIREALDGEARIQFQQAADLVAGIEMAADGHKVSWSVSGYLSSLEDTAKEIGARISSIHEQSE